MIYHALTIVTQALNAYLKNRDTNTDKVVLANLSLADIQGPDDILSMNGLVLSLVNMREEKSLKNAPFSRRISDEQVAYFNPPVHLNLYILISACQKDYKKALVYLSRIIRFFQSNNVFTPENVVSDLPPQGEDRLEQFRMIVDLHSPTIEELNQLWNMLGGKQYPSVMYIIRLLELRDISEKEADTVREVELGAEPAKNIN